MEEQTMWELISNIWVSYIQPCLLIISPIAAFIFACKSNVYRKKSLECSKQSASCQQKAFEYSQTLNTADLEVNFIPAFSKSGDFECSITLENKGKHRATNVRYIIQYYSDRQDSNNIQEDKKTVDSVNSENLMQLVKWPIAKKYNNYFLIEISYNDAELQKELSISKAINLVREDDTWKRIQMTKDEITYTKDAFRS